MNIIQDSQQTKSKSTDQINQKSTQKHLIDQKILQLKRIHYQNHIQYLTKFIKFILPQNIEISPSRFVKFVSLFKNFHLFVILQILNYNLTLYSFNIQFIIFKNFRIYTVDYYQSRILLCRLFNKLNNPSKLLNYKINVTNGQIRVSFQTKILKKELSEINQQKFGKIVIEKERYSITEISYSMIRILQSINEQNMDGILKELKQQKKTKFGSEVLNELVDYIKSRYNNSNEKNLKILQYSQIVNKQLIFLNGEDKNQKNRKCEIIEQNHYKKNEAHIIVKSSNINQKITILNEIQVINPKQVVWHRYAQTNLSIISISRVDFRYIDNKNRDYTFKKILVMKEVKKQQYLERQIQNLKILKKQVNIFIGKYYYSNQIQFKNKALFSDFYGQKTLDNYIQSHSLTISIFTILYLFTQCIQALRFLKQHHILHLDLKPQNILIGKSLLIKLIDFGSAHSKLSKIKYNQKNYSVPYTSPQYFLNSADCYKSDVYSLCVMFHKFLFERFPIEYSQKQSEIKYMKNMRGQGSYISSGLPQIIRSRGPNSYLQLIKYMILKGLSHNKQQRPQLEILLNLCKQGIVFLDKIF